MRIISVRLTPVATVFAIIYALLAFLTYAFDSVRFFTLPIGIIFGIFHWNISINLARSTNLIQNALLCLAAILSYAFSGWITGIVIVLFFNLTAAITGGVDAKYVVTATDAAANLSTPPAPLHT